MKIDKTTSLKNTASLRNTLAWFFVAALPVLAIGCTGITFLGHFAVLAVTLGIFVGTLSLNKVRAPLAPSSDADAANVDPK